MDAIENAVNDLVASGLTQADSAKAISDGFSVAISIIAQKNQTIAAMFTKTQLDQAVAEANAAKDLIITQKNQTIATLDEAITQKEQSIAILNESIIQKDQTIALMFTQAQFNKAIADANAAKDLIISQKEQTIASMFTEGQLDEAVIKERLKYDINGDGVIRLAEVVYYLQLLAGFR